MPGRDGEAEEGRERVGREGERGRDEGDEATRVRQDELVVVVEVELYVEKSQLTSIKVQGESERDKGGREDGKGGTERDAPGGRRCSS